MEEKPADRMVLKSVFFVCLDDNAKDGNKSFEDVARFSAWHGRHLKDKAHSPYS